MSKKKVVIVESPAKSKTINKILGSEYIVLASMGHIKDLPKNKMGVDIEHGFKPTYIVIPDRRKYLAKLKKETKNIDTIFLACDPDREGEAICWHLENELGKEKNVFRVAFDEITASSVKEAFRNPRSIDIRLVDAQQARRLLDRIVGYTISPLLWRKITRGLSAGRVQSVAVRLIVERENEIRNFVSEEYWEIEARLKKQSKERRSFLAKLIKIDGRAFKIGNEKKAEELINDIKRCRFR